MFFIKAEYVERSEPEYFVDNVVGTIHQPDVYPFAAHVARRLGCEAIIDIGCGRGQKLAQLHPEFHVIGIDFGDNIEYCAQHYPFGTWIPCNLEENSQMVLPTDVVGKAIVVCADVIEHLVNPVPLLALLRGLMAHAPYGILTTPERDLVRGAEHFGPPPNLSHVREWNLDELRTLLQWSGIDVEFSGLTVNNDSALQKRTSICVLGHGYPNRVPPEFKVIAIMSCYNEADVIVPSIRYLVEQGVQVYVLDNWSTDGSYALAQDQIGNGVIGVERFPATGPSPCYDWNDILTRVEELAFALDANWFIHNDVDEFRESPWEGVSLREAMYRVDWMGFNCVDHTVLNFHPIDNGYRAGSDVKSYFRHWEWGQRPGHFAQRKAWKKTAQRVKLAESGGHDVQFAGRRIFPHNFLTRHFPIRSQNHGETKIFKERKSRWNPSEREKGWHVQYDALVPGHSFVCDPAALAAFDDAKFKIEYLVERLSRVGIRREPERA